MTLAIPNMNAAGVYDSLERVGSMHPGGCVVELGTWLGASAAAVTRGLATAGVCPPLHLYDFWQASEAECEKAVKQGMKLRPGDDLLPYALDNIGYGNTHPHRGDVAAAAWCGQPIGIMVLDQAKRDPGWSHMLNTFSPHWIDGCILCLLDFTFWERYRGVDKAREEIYRVQERWARASTQLEPLKELDAGTARFFRWRSA